MSSPAASAVSPIGREGEHELTGPDRYRTQSKSLRCYVKRSTQRPVIPFFEPLVFDEMVFH
jgi:hypothetical protein